MTFVSELRPSSLWSYFDQILAIPRGSKEEDRVRAWVLGIAEESGLEHDVDATGNVVVRKPGSAGREAAPGTVLQSHLDMVNEKNSEVDFDFSNDAIRPVLDGAYLTADGTTLGSDNGIGVAAMLAVMADTELEHGPLEFLFTVDEETGLTGARGLDAGMLKGRRLLNLDTEEEGALTVGCAGGADTRLVLALETQRPSPSSVARRVRLRGLQGGHSGVDIHLQRGNAVQLLARIVRGSEAAGHLTRLEGGDKHNAIPREAEALLVMPEATAGEVEAALHDRFEGVRSEFSGPDPDMRLEIAEGPVPDAVWTGETGARVLDLIVALPHGVVAMSNDIPGLVETSTNLAAVECQDNELHVLTSSRSSVGSGMGWVRAKIDAVAALSGATAHHRNGYPGWKPNLSSPLLQVVEAVHQRVMGQKPRVEAIHAGLECGIIGEMVPGMEMISFGPQIEFPHSPSERVHVESVERFYRLLTEVLKELAS